MKFAAPPYKQHRGGTASAMAELLARRESSIKRRTAEVEGVLSHEMGSFEKQRKKITFC